MSLVAPNTIGASTPLTVPGILIVENGSYQVNWGVSANPASMITPGVTNPLTLWQLAIASYSASGVFPSLSAGLATGNVPVLETGLMGALANNSFVFQVTAAPVIVTILNQSGTSATLSDLIKTPGTMGSVRGGYVPSAYITIIKVN